MSNKNGRVFFTVRDFPLSCAVEMADVKAVLLSYQEEGLAPTREGEEGDKEVVVKTRVNNFTDRLLLLKQLRALVRTTQIHMQEPHYIMITSCIYTHQIS